MNSNDLYFHLVIVLLLIAEQWLYHTRQKNVFKDASINTVFKCVLHSIANLMLSEIIVFSSVAFLYLKYGKESMLVALVILIYYTLLLLYRLKKILNKVKEFKE